ncbi:hypothetical protein ACX27_18275 [Nostoc piscinale CENA21]|uniref:Ice-binding protein C-terminal domain-containing protein n=1 Tax=Nostoc piscinale CENA21 TaxID=224013 RepID=A0A0M3V5V8_9NOSO|nr:cistern family PEP-CTERM protein [Nostoc piscinale]ALF54347.1 hypothetical protein ACX27_18275 [Nostoc piscinale CENA21]
MKINSAFSALLAASSIAVASSVLAPAQAITITPTGATAGEPSGQTLYQAAISRTNDIGKSFDINWNLAPGSNTGKLSQPLSATSTWTITNFTTSALDLQIRLTNTTATTPQDIAARLTSMAFGVNPEANGIVFTKNDGITTDTDVFSAALTGLTAGNFNNIDIDVCFIGGNNCQGGGNGGLRSNQTDILNLKIKGNFTSDTAFLQFFAARFQTSQGSYVLAGNGTPGTPVPEPITMLGLGVGTVGLGALKRRYGNKKAKVTV